MERLNTAPPKDAPSNSENSFLVGKRGSLSSVMMFFPFLELFSPCNAPIVISMDLVMMKKDERGEMEAEFWRVLLLLSSLLSLY